MAELPGRCRHSNQGFRLNLYYFLNRTNLEFLLTTTLCSISRKVFLYFLLDDLNAEIGKSETGERQMVRADATVLDTNLAG
jgi:hypothetical protein